MIVATGVLLLSRWASRPVIVGGPSTAVEGIQSSRSFESLSTDYYTTTIPDELAVKSQNNARHGNTLSQTFLVNEESNFNNPLTDQLAITVGNLPSEGVTGLTDVQFRSRNPEKYSQVSQSSFPEGSKVFVSTANGYEKSVFWPYDGRYAAVVVSGTSDRATEINKDLDIVMTSWKWKVE